MARDFAAPGNQNWRAHRRRSGMSLLAAQGFYRPTQWSFSAPYSQLRPKAGCLGPARLGEMPRSSALVGQRPASSGWSPAPIRTIPSTETANHARALDDPAIGTIAAAHGKTAAQAMLR